MSGVNFVMPDEAQAIAANVLIQAEDKANMILERQVVLIFEQGERQIVVPLSPVGAGQVAQAILQAASEASQALDPDELDEVEVSFTKRRDA